MNRSHFVSAAVILLLVLTGSPTGAANLSAPTGVAFAVNSTALDEPDAHPGDGKCKSTPSGKCTLRAAVMETNALGGGNTIILNSGTYFLSIPGRDENNAKRGDLDIKSNVTIKGNGPAKTKIDANGIDRVFQVLGNANATISGIELNGGDPGSGSGQVGGGILVNSGATLHLNLVEISGNTAMSGGGVFNEGSVRIKNSSMTDNHYANDGGGIYNQGKAKLLRAVLFGNTGGNSGGGIGNNGMLLLKKSRADNNSAHFDGGGMENHGKLTVVQSAIIRNIAQGGGGGIYNVYGNVAGSGRIQIVNSTIANNTANGSGGGIVNYSNATVSLFNVTLASNQADNDTSGDGTGGGIHNEGVFHLRNTIVDSNTIAQTTPPYFYFNDCFGNLSSGDYNVISDGACVSNGGKHDKLGMDSKLGALQDHGGPTWTMALLPGSPALDRGNPKGCDDNFGSILASDQRAFLRPTDGDGDGKKRCDIGAFEAQP